MANRIGTRVAIACGIIRTTAADRIKDDQKRTSHA
jgi:hypothetical protein